ncbi:hypothetical protein G5I_04795 [Acromyrmex echinatior]|uniref:Uncharacterized protein n=1 Tax=Acromyrmex echinatior TaxID=103372 RepID=F4WGL3_ACREC|nr:hypothetical protein G5I_04795 [Acromyrmex echinatior]
MSRRLTRRLEYPEPGTLGSTRNQGSVLGTWAIKKWLRPPSHKVYIGAQHQSNPMNACQVAGRKVSVVAVYSVTATCDDKWRIAKNHFERIAHKEIESIVQYYAMALKDMFKNAYKTNAHERRCGGKRAVCGFSGPQPRETGYCRCRLSKPLITCFANAALGIALMMSLKYWINKLLHVKPLCLAKENSLLKTNFASNASWNFADNEVHASWFQSTARASREMSVNAARHQGHLPLQPRVTDIIMLITSATLSNRLHVKQRTRSERPTFSPFVVPLFHRTFGSEQATLKNIERMHKRMLRIYVQSCMHFLLDKYIIEHRAIQEERSIFWKCEKGILGAEKKFETNQTKRTKNDVSRELKHEALALKGKQRG